MTQLTEHFSLEELSCRHCGDMLFTEAALERLEGLRVEFAHPIPINSGYRCPQYNNEVSETGWSGPHTITDRDNITIDARVHGKLGWELVALARVHGFTGIGVSQKGPWEGRFLHLDSLWTEGARVRPWLWSY